jgi:hypothetical protein
MIKFGNKIKDKLNSNQFDMFGDSKDAIIQAPTPSISAEWSTMELLSNE